MDAILGMIGLILFLILVIKVCILFENKGNKSVVRLFSDTIKCVMLKEISQKEHMPVAVKYYTYSAEPQKSTPTNKDQVSAPTKNSSSDNLLNNPYYNKYRKTFDIIRYSGKEPKYRIDWLLKSLDMGHELEHDGVFVTASISKNFPYFCETEEEFERLSKDDGLALKGSVAAIFGLGYLYSGSHMRTFLPEKRSYWRNQILEMAKSGNLDAQAGLCRRNMLFTDGEIEVYKREYESRLIHMAEDGNAYAQLAVGQFIAQNRKEKMEWLIKAGEQGLSDAYYYLANAYEQMRFLDDELNYKSNVSLDEKEEKLIDEKKGECYLKGAKLNNGMMAVECQSMVANAYRYGYYGFEKDLVHARYWYEIAFKNGKEYAGSCIGDIDKFGI